MLQKDKKKEEEETLRMRSTIDESSTNGVEGCRKYRGRALSFFFFFGEERAERRGSV